MLLRWRDDEGQRFVCLLAGQESNVVLQHWSNPVHVPARRRQWGHQRHALAYTGNVLPESPLFISGLGKQAQQRGGAKKDV